MYIKRAHLHVTDTRLRDVGDQRKTSVVPPSSGEQAIMFASLIQTLLFTAKRIVYLYLLFSVFPLAALP